MKINERKIKKILEGVNWDFSDYNSSRNPLDLNSIPWYPATFIPPIPKLLIQLLTGPGQVVLDPFGGKGTTTIESIKQGRISIYNDINPFAADITQSLLDAIEIVVATPYELKDEENRIKSYTIIEDNIAELIDQYEISDDVYAWYETKTLMEILSIINMINTISKPNTPIYNVRKLALTSILKQTSSQPGHFTYITDNCKPKTGEKIYKNAFKLYVDRVNQIMLSVEDLHKQYLMKEMQDELYLLSKKTRVKVGDARNLDWINTESVDLVLTSPPYLCSQDYIKTMRLIHLFFPNNVGFNESVKKEIGSRSKRQSNQQRVINNFYFDLNLVFSEIYRVLSPNAYFCLIIGQGKSKITKGFNTIEDLCNDLVSKHQFREIYHSNRTISSRVIQVGGVNKEDIIIFQKKS